MGSKPSTFVRTCQKISSNSKVYSIYCTYIFFTYTVETTLVSRLVESPPVVDYRKTTRKTGIEFSLEVPASTQGDPHLDIKK